MARLLLLRRSVVRAFRRAAFLLLALAGVAIAASPANADSINLLRPGTSRLSPSILFDSSTGIFGSDEDVTSQLDRDCVAIDEDVRGSWSRFGRVDWRFGSFAWEWEPAHTPAIVYVICVDRRGRSPAGGGGGIGGGMSGGMQMAAALSWSGQGAATANGPGVLATSSSDVAAQPIAKPDLIKGPTPGPDAAGPLTDPPLTRLDPRITVPPMTDPQIVEMLIGLGQLMPGPPPTGAPASWTPSLESQMVVPPISLDPVDAPPVPEPGTWLLLGSGLAAAWRARRRGK